MVDSKYFVDVMDAINTFKISLHPSSSTEFCEYSDPLNVADISIQILRLNRCKICWKKHFETIKPSAINENDMLEILIFEIKKTRRKCVHVTATPILPGIVPCSY